MEEVTKEYAAKHFARGQADAMLRMLSGIQAYMNAADCLDKETKADCSEMKTILLRIKTRLE